jgi:DNA-directed RNA polymerase
LGDITSFTTPLKHPAGTSLYARPYNDPIKLDTTTRTPEQLILVANGLHGTVRELMVHLHTCVIVGRRERAQAIVARLSEQCGVRSPEIRYAHRAILGEMLRSMATNPSGSLRAKAVLAEMQKWFEVEVRNRGVPIEAQILIIMMRASVFALEGSRMDRSIRRYAEIARDINDEVFEEVLNSEEYDENEYMIVGRATSDYYEEEAVPEDELQRAQDTQKDLIATYRAPPTAGFVDLDSIPEVRAVATKSSGLRNIQSMMTALTGLPPLPPDAAPEDRLKRAFERQHKLEKSAVEVAVERWRQEDEELRKIGIHTAMQTKPIGAMMWQWYSALLPAIKEEAAASATALAGPKTVADDRFVYGPFMELLPAEKLAANTILTIMGTLMSGRKTETDTHKFDVKVINLTSAIANAIEQEWSAHQNIQTAGNKRSRRSMAKTRRTHKNVHAVSKDPNAETGAALPLPEIPNAIQDKEWPKSAKLKMGAMLLSKFLECATIPVTREHPRTEELISRMQPAFLYRVHFHYGKKTGMIVPHEALSERLQSEPLGSLVCKSMPMVVEPKPWTGWQSGGYLHYDTPILRLSNGDKTGREYFEATDREGDLSTLYKGLTALGKVPWKINRDVFNVQLEAWNSGLAIANFPPLEPDLPTPIEPEASLDPSARRKWLAELRETENKKSAFHSQRSFQNFQLEIARSLLNETLYFPHNLDFRGRAYPISPYLNHMGADNVRALLTFAEGKPLGATGLRWLKIHLATVAGYDKASLDDRVKFTTEHFDDIQDSVLNPLGGRRWWLSAEDAWQTLAACFELTNALNSPDPEKYVSYLPMQQDGTCNGLQHYAALGGDQAGAKQVNLEPSDKPADVYTAVADAVRAHVQKDADAGHEIAKLINGRITRKCVKQPVMTNVYGVTFYGAKLQVLKNVNVMLPESGCPPGVTPSAVAHYVALKIFKSLGDMFTGAQAIQQWLGTCADRISTALSPEQIQKAILAEKKKKTATNEPAKRVAAKKPSTNAGLKDIEKVSQSATDAGKSMKPFFKSTVVWTTPLGLPVVQPYRKPTSQVVKTSLQQMSISEPRVWDPVNKRKQLQAFPPNFIHSLDSTHMLLSALKFDEIGKTFASVHDSFWTHACDVDTLSEVLRDAFISMHSEDIIGRLREEFQTRYQGCFQLLSVERNSPAGRQILELREKDAANPTTSAMSGVEIELERLRLLNSDDAAEREKGASMITAASIVQSLSGIENTSPVSEEIQAQGLGKLPDDASESDLSKGADLPSLAAGVEIVSEPLDAVLSGQLDHADIDADDGNTHGERSTGDPSEPASPPSKISRTKATKASKIFAWVPLEFPPVPEKGSFDVTKIQQSKYFFH